MVSITENYPPLDLEELVGIVNDFKNYTIDKKIEVITRIVSKHPFLNFPTVNDDRVFYRARISKNGSFPFSYTGLLWNHSAPAQRARLNLNGDAILYVANQASAAFSEIGVDDNFVIMSVLKVQPEKNVTFLPLGTFANIMRSNSAHLDFPEALVTETRKKILACPTQEMQSLLIADEFIYNCIMEEDEDYTISSKTANLIFNKYPTIDAITYPSKKLRSANNYALKTCNFWEKWKIEHACILKVKHLALGHFLHSDCRCVESIDNSGFMSWQRSYPLHQNSLIPLNWVKP
ncbi:hypothetical protein BK673_24525 [Pseudomonas fluorescens]|uniref:Uncharacterized protein n=1 Tax=Pseudomonas fluorescens TaxID=294 RepID=A0A423NZM3_PSEFL|nr:RES domain-containing protein [Pseudomonas fluorescens]ROO03847.1 hypothetical protein BK673_24525 [Pseudomonas fluorescens]